MSGYQRGQSPQPGKLMTVEQARRRNAELRLALLPVMAEYADLVAEKAELDAKVEALRADLTAARGALAAHFRDLDAIRTQTGNIAALTQNTTEPVFGGQVGLEAAAERPGRKGTSHGTQRRYTVGCRCDACLGWRERKSAQAVEQNKLRREREIADALAAHGVVA